MGGPELNPMMQRTRSDPGPRSSTQPPGVGSSAPTPRRAAATASARFCASGVKGGILPSGGSTISDVRKVPMTLLLPSYQDISSFWVLRLQR
jgi:hypothetical protein